MAERHGWRDHYPPHPCADVFPMMTDTELDDLARDIQQHGLREPVTVWHDGARQYLLDGRNRLEALTRVGLEITPNHIREYAPSSHVDLAAYVISKNIHRRHLTKEQHAILIWKALEAAGSTDGAKMARSATRSDDGRVSGSTRDPDLAAAVREGQKCGISARTIKRARAKRRGSGTSKRQTAALSDGPASTPSTKSAAAVETRCALDEVKSAIRKAVEGWPPDASLQLLIDHLRDEATQLAERDLRRKEESVATG